jgi:hypothetical protein
MHPAQEHEVFQIESEKKWYKNGMKISSNSPNMFEYWPKKEFISHEIEHWPWAVLDDNLVVDERVEKVRVNRNATTQKCVE